MEIKFDFFPQAYFNTNCTKHECPVEIRIRESTRYRQTAVLGGEITALKCQVGGQVQVADCMDDWQISILGGGPITIGE